jgi:hypothetical protein
VLVLVGRFVNIVLAPFAGVYDPLGIRHRGWPVEALLEHVSDQGLGRGMMPANPAMDILQQLLPLFDRGNAAGSWCDSICRALPRWQRRTLFGV